MTGVVFDQGAEKAVLAALLLRPEAIDRVELEPGDFHEPAAQLLFGSMQKLRGAGKVADPITIADDLRRPEVVAMCSSLLSEAVTADNVEYYAAIVADRSRLRRLAIAAGEIAAQCQSGKSADEVQAIATAKLAEVWKRTPDATKSMGALVVETFKHLSALNDARGSGGGSWGLPTGFAELDLLLGGIQPGAVTILAGRPSMGKSSLARSIAEAVALSGKGVHVFSAEDSARSYTLRCLSDGARIDLHRLRGVELQRQEMGSLMGAAERLNLPHWLVDDSAALSSAQVAMRTRKHLDANKTALVVVDYVQLLREPGAKDEREHVERAAVGMQRLAREAGVGLLLLSQLSRACEGRPLNDRRPVLSDLRESGVLEQIADAVVFLYRDEVYNPQTQTPNEGEAIVRKNKHGRTGAVHMQWDGPTATYRPLERYRRYE